MSIQLDNRTENALWAFLVRLDRDTVEDVFNFRDGGGLSEKQINQFTDTLVELKVSRVSTLDDLSSDALRAFLSRVGSETIEKVLVREWAGTKLTDSQVEEFQFSIFRLYTMSLYVPFQKTEESL